MTSYREFRKAITDEASGGPHFDPCVDIDCQANTFTQGRWKIRHFRETLSSGHYFEQNPEHEPFVRRALRIPPSIELFRTPWQAIAQFLIGAFAPFFVVFRRARSLLAEVKTFEGRQLVYKLHIGLTIDGRSNSYFDEACDKIFKWFDNYPSEVEFKGLTRLNLEWITAFRLLNVRKAQAVLHEHDRVHMRLDGSYVLLLVQRGVIQSSSELTWVPDCIEPLYHAHSSNCDRKRYKTRTCRMLDTLLAHGVELPWIPTLISYPLWGYDANALDQRLVSLERRGISRMEALRAVGERVWMSDEKQWETLCDEIGAKSGHDIALFRDYLESDVTVHRSVVQRLKARGATLNDLAHCQKLMLVIGKHHDRDPPLDEIDFLLAAPYEISFMQLGQCLEYLKKPADLKAYLAVLIAHRHTSPEAVLAFQANYGLSPWALDRLLTLAANCMGTDTPFALANWITVASRNGRYETYEYLVGQFKPRNVANLTKMVKMSHLGASFIEYMIERNHVKTLDDLYRWYYDRESVGVPTLVRIQVNDTLDRAVIQDAFSRKRFQFIQGNQERLTSAISERIEAQIGRWSPSFSEEDNVKYNSKRSAIMQVLRDDLVSTVTNIFKRTSGILPSSILELQDKSSTELDGILGRFATFFEALAVGRGPDAERLDELECDAVGLFYQTDPDTIRKYWRDVVGKTSAFRTLNLKPGYSMTWHTQRWQLTGVVDFTGIAAWIKALEYAERFKTKATTDAFEACKKLSPKQLKDDSADHATLARHFGILLAVCEKAELVKDWTVERLGALERCDSDDLLRAELAAIEDFFQTDLKDALNQCMEKFVATIEPNDAMHLAQRLGYPDKTATPHEQLANTLELTANKVQKHFLRWVIAQKARFEEVPGDGTTRLKAHVSDHPASFFARHAANLCTKFNIAMWREPRHAHLIVVDPKARAFVGMAYLYLVVIEEIDATVPALVIRAINPTQNMANTYTPDSIIDSYLNVVCEIAVENDLAAVITLNDGDLMSNRTEIHRKLTKRHLCARREGMPLAITNGGWVCHMPPRHLSARFDAYEEGGSTKADLFVLAERRRDEFPRLPEMHIQVRKRIGPRVS